MLKKLRWRFIFSAMTAIFAVMAILLLAINILNFSITTKRLDATLQRLETHGDAALESLKSEMRLVRIGFCAGTAGAERYVVFFCILQ